MAKIIENNLFEVDNDFQTRYTTDVNIPQYLPNCDKPSIYSLCDTYKYEQLVQEINQSDLSKEEKDFLKLAATRHIVFNYSKIADYYANSDPKTQRLMEKSALVLIDVDDAIANGYVKLSQNIRKIMLETGRHAAVK